MILEFQRGNTRVHSRENSPWKRLWTCRKKRLRNERMDGWMDVNITDD